MRYETPEVIEVGAANDVTLGITGTKVDDECTYRPEDSDVAYVAN